MWVLKRSWPEEATLVALAVQVGPKKEKPVLFPAALVATLVGIAAGESNGRGGTFLAGDGGMHVGGEIGKG
jgi:hypothetical protein